MPRSKKKSNKSNTALTVEQMQALRDKQLAQETNTISNTKEKKKMAGLTAEQIQALLANTRQKGIYLQYLNQFVSSGLGGVNVNEDYPELKDKKAATLKQGFENAKNHKDAPAGSDQIRVISNDDLVYLLNPAAAGLAPEDVADLDEDEVPVPA